MIEIASHIKQAIFFTILANVIIPWGMTKSMGYAAVITGVLIYIAKLIALAFGVAVLEVSVAKMRLFRVVDFLSLALVLAIIAVITAGMGL
jgi:formate hydrogenlyase subunit 4